MEGCQASGIKRITSALAQFRVGRISQYDADEVSKEFTSWTSREVMDVPADVDENKFELTVYLLATYQAPLSSRDAPSFSLCTHSVHKHPLSVAKPLWPFVTASLLTFYLVSKAQDMGVKSETYRNDPRNPYAAQIAKQSHH
ncbi:hypothetical protein A0H81_10876 [Grifola frondosa]|uniref:Uncharacterized protein n=1 Tax=Grifola frondosa TaxID=5627 RepID=A0A1C7LX67_GRIFR|nr:hypothetical protein A0H81_10876 [Grifola frondosa]